MDPQRSHYDYYKYQNAARRILNASDVLGSAADQANIYRIARRWLPQRPDTALLELACGHGSFLAWLRAEGYSQAYGVDSSVEQVRLASSAGLKAEVADAFDRLRETPDRTLDALIAIDFIEHISKDRLMDLLAESSRVLRPGAYLVVRYPNGDSPFVGLNLFNDITHVWTYTTNCLTSLAGMHGFTGVEFVDQSVEAIRDARWWKVPVAKAVQALLGALAQAACRERPRFWSPSIWAGLRV